MFFGKFIIILNNYLIIKFISFTIYYIKIFTLFLHFIKKTIKFLIKLLDINKIYYKNIFINFYN